MSDRLSNNRVNFLNKRFFKLLVIEDVGTHRTAGGSIRSKWKCLCDCGKVVIRRADSLKPNKKCSCGCFLKAARKDPHEMGITVVFATYKENALTKNNEFSLNREQFTDLILGNCYYCNCTPSAVSRNRKGHAKVVYNGIDRKDNHLGYTVENSVTCCRDCNYMKNVRNFDEFINKIKKIYENLDLVQAKVPLI